MREGKPSIYNFTSRVFVIFSVMVLFQALIGQFFGDDTMEYSTMFQLGSRGIARETLLQFLLSAIITTSLNTLFFSEKTFKNLTIFWRGIIMLLLQLIIMIGFIIFFRWFPVDNLVDWGIFLLTFVGSIVISLLVMVLKSNSDNKKYDDLLTDYKNNQKRENGE